MSKYKLQILSWEIIEDCEYKDYLDEENSYERFKVGGRIRIIGSSATDTTFMLVVSETYHKSEHKVTFNDNLTKEEEDFAQEELLKLEIDYFRTIDDVTEGHYLKKEIT